MGKKVITAVLTLFLVACETSQPISGNPCGPFRPIRPLESDMEVISEHLRDEIGIFNATGADLCNWTP